MVYGPDGIEQLLAAFNRMRHNLIRSEFERHGLKTASHPPILFTLYYEVKGRVASQKELARIIGISAPTAAISIKRMEKAGLLCKTSDASDQRKNLIALTPKGETLVKECAEIFTALDSQTFRGFSAREKEDLKGYYMRMIANLEAAGATPPQRLKKE
jgi:DNA-binding MarR family transcriptional regulator